MKAPPLFSLALLWATGLLLAGCDHADSPGGKPVIVATIYPLADLTRQIVGDAAEVVTLIPPGTNPHGYEPTANVAEQMSRAKALVMVGMNFDEWARDAMKTHAAAGSAVVVMSDELGLTQPRDPAAGPAPKHHHDHDDDHEANNPHLWVDHARIPS